MSRDAAGWRMLERTRALDYVTLQGLSTLTGCEATNLDALIMKELVDNGLDAASGGKPRIAVAFETGDGFLTLTVRDNGEGMPSSDIERIVDYSRLYSTKFHDRTPTRGALGNAYNILLGAPYALAAKNVTATRDEVAAYLECTGRTISDKARFLKGLQLLKSSKEGYRFAGKGVRFVRRWLPSVTGGVLQSSYEEEKKLALAWLSDPQIIPLNKGWATLEEFKRFLSACFEGRLDKGAELFSLMIDEGLVELNDYEGDLIRLVKIEKEVG